MMTPSALRTNLQAYHLLASNKMNSVQRSSPAPSLILRGSAESSQFTSGKLGNPLKAIGQWFKELLNSFGALFTKPDDVATKNSHDDHAGHQCGPNCPTHGEDYKRPL